MIPTFDRDHLPSDPVTWPAWSKHAMTRALRIDGPFAVVTAEGALTCNDGFLAIDARGYPYPIAADEFARIYARHDATELQLSTFKRRDRLGRMRWYFHVAAENGEVVVQSEVST